MIKRANGLSEIKSCLPDKNDPAPFEKWLIDVRLRELQSG